MNTTINHHKRAVLITFVLLVGVLAVPVLLTWQQVRQARLNRSLLLAVRRNDTETVTALLAQKADPNARELPPSAGSFWPALLEQLSGHSRQNNQFPTALLVALHWRENASRALVVPPPHNLALVKALIERGANVNISDSSGAVPLLLAAREGQRDVVHYLIDQGANVNAKDERGNTPLSVVSAWHNATPEDTAIINALLDRGADINGAYHLGTTPLMFALQTGNSATIRLLVARHADVNRKDSRGVSALSLAQNGTDKEVLKLLQMAGAK